MNKKANTLLFILGATVFNILTTVICFFVLYIPFAIYVVPHIPETGGQWGLIAIMIAAFALSFIIYRAALKLLMKKVNVEKYFDPIFGKPRR
jgi:hypothetical protein